MAHQESIASDKKFIPYGVLHYFFSGQSYGEVLGSLLRSHEKNSTLFSGIKTEEVEFWYNSFKSGNFDMEQDPTLNPRPMIENVPVLDQNIDDIDETDQESLGQVSDDSDDSIEEEHRVSKNVQLKLYKDFVVFNVEDGIDSKQCQKTYKKKEKGCEITDLEKKKSESEDYFIEAAMSDFRTIVEEVDMRIKTLSVKYHMTQVVDVADRNKFLKGAAEVVSSVNGPLYVEKIDMALYESAELEPYLKALKPGILTDIRLVTAKKVERNQNEQEGNADNKPLKLKDVPSYELHSEHLFGLSIISYIGDVNIADFAHIQRVTLFVSKLTPQRLAAYKPILLQPRIFTGHTFHSNGEVRVDDASMKEYSDALQPYGKNGLGCKEDKLNGSFSCPGTDCEHMKFTVGVCSIFISNHHPEHNIV